MKNLTLGFVFSVITGGLITHVAAASNFGIHETLVDQSWQGGSLTIERKMQDGNYYSAMQDEPVTADYFYARERVASEAAGDLLRENEIRDPTQRLRALSRARDRGTVCGTEIHPRSRLGKMPGVKVFGNGKKYRIVKFQAELAGAGLYQGRGTDPRTGMENESQVAWTKFDLMSEKGLGFSLICFVPFLESDFNSRFREGTRSQFMRGISKALGSKDPAAVKLNRSVVEVE